MRSGTGLLLFNSYSFNRQDIFFFLCCAWGRPLIILLTEPTLFIYYTSTLSHCPFEVPHVNVFLDSKNSLTYYYWNANHLCFIFTKAEEITLTIGQAFDLAYRKFLESGGKDVETRKQIAGLQKRVSKLNLLFHIYVM